jgi:hypothetical protein
VEAVARGTRDIRTRYGHGNQELFEYLPSVYGQEAGEWEAKVDRQPSPMRLSAPTKPRGLLTAALLPHGVFRSLPSTGTDIKRHNSSVHR